MRKIKLSQNKYALVDDEEYEYLNQWKWSYKKHEGYSGYAIRFDRVGGHNKSVRMHRLLMKTPANLDCDHINGNGLDNQKSNLRNCSHQNNQRNRKRNFNVLSKFKGVYLDKRGKRNPSAQITIDAKTIRIGSFREERHAAIAYDLWARDIYGEFAQVNFPIN